ncbi:MAG: ribbon-helix-helix protein, CopG family [Solirubrobacteraceae bacterium]
MRFSPILLERLDHLAQARKLSRSACLRALVADAALVAGEEVPGEDELLAILAERARAGNVGAVRMLLERQAHRDPAEAAFEREFGGLLDAE